MGISDTILNKRPLSGRFFVGVLLLFLLVTRGLCAQKRSVRTIDAAQIHKVHVAADNMYEAKLRSHDRPVILLEVSIEGEYQSELAVSVLQESNTLFVRGGFLPSFENPNDKLSAHKVVSVGLKLTVPHEVFLELNGSTTHVTASGYFDHLKIRTTKGPVQLEAVQGLVEVSTFAGGITATDLSGEVSANSRYGQTFIGQIPKGNAEIVLETINGDIYINKQE